MIMGVCASIRGKGEKIAFNAPAIDAKEQWVAKTFGAFSGYDYAFDNATATKHSLELNLREAEEKLRILRKKPTLAKLKFLGQI